MDTKGRALVTGASSGIGEAFARRLARDGYGLVLCARRAERLEALAADLRARHGVTVEVLPADLAEPGTAARVAVGALAGGPIDLLVNNAGVGLFGPFSEIPVERALAVVRLNIEALVDLTWRLAGPMRERRRGAIIQVASATAFQPLPYVAVYAATKAFVLSFGEAISEELRADGVRVLTVCPGTTDTEFLGASAALSHAIRAPRGMSAARVVSWALLGLRLRFAFIVAGIGNWVLSLLGRATPHFFQRRVTGAALRALLRRRKS